MTETDEIMQDGRALRDVIDQTMGDVVGPTARLQENALSQGRRLRTRRRTRIALGAVACAGVAVLGLPQLVGGSSGVVDGAPQYAADPTPTTSASTPPENLTGWWDMPAPEMRERLEAILPAGTQVVDSVVMNDDRGPGEAYGPMHGYLLANLTSPTSNGPGGLNLVLSPPVDAGGSPGLASSTDAEGNSVTQASAESPSITQRISCPGNLTNPDRCTELRDPDGRHYGRTSIWTGGGVTVYEVVVKTADDGLVYLATANTNDDKWGAGSNVTADETPLTMAEMRAIALNPTWTSWLP